MGRVSAGAESFASVYLPCLIENVTIADDRRFIRQKHLQMISYRPETGNFYVVQFGVYNSTGAVSIAYAYSSD